MPMRCRCDADAETVTNTTHLRHRQSATEWYHEYVRRRALNIEENIELNIEENIEEKIEENIEYYLYGLLLTVE